LSTRGSSSIWLQDEDNHHHASGGARKNAREGVRGDKRGSGDAGSCCEDGSKFTTTREPSSVDSSYAVSSVDVEPGTSGTVDKSSDTLPDLCEAEGVFS